MRDYANPVLLLLITAFWALAVSDPADTETSWLTPGLWLLTLCATGCIVNALLCLARGLARRPAMAGALWSMAHLVLGSCAYAYLSHDNGLPRETQAKYRSYISEKADSPYTPDAEGDTLLSLAAAMGKDAVVRRILSHHPHSEQEQAALCRAAWEAARQGQEKALRVLLSNGVSADAEAEGLTLLIAAATGGHKNTLRALLESGADVNKPDTEGNTALIHAVIQEDLPAVRLLREHGADSAARNHAGRSAADYSRSGAVDALL